VEAQGHKFAMARRAIGLKGRKIGGVVPDLLDACTATHFYPVI